jgi:hypothetical protein
MGFYLMIPELLEFGAVIYEFGAVRVVDLTILEQSELEAAPRLVKWSQNRYKDSDSSANLVSKA